MNVVLIKTGLILMEFVFVSATAAFSYHAFVRRDSSKYLPGGLAGPTTMTTWFSAFICAVLSVLISFVFD